MAATKREIDAVLTELPGGIYDLVIEDGDILTKDAFDTAIIVSLLTDRRADESEVLISQDRRGWIGNEYTPGIQIGSKLWLFEQTRLSREVVNQIGDVAREALQWMVEDGLAIAIREVTVEFLPASSPSLGVQIRVLIERSNSIVEQRFFDFWPVTALPIDEEPFSSIVNPPGTPIPLGVTQSLDLNGVDEYFEDSVDSPVGIANEWTLALWVKMDTSGVDEVVFHIVSGANTNRILFQKEMTGSLVQIQVGLNKDFTLPDSEFIGVWSHHVFTFDGSRPVTDQLRWYVNGVERTGDDVTKVSDSTQSMVDENRSITVGRRHAPGGLEFEGLIHTIGIWDTSLTPDAVAAIYNGGNGDVDFRVDFGDYTMSGDLVRYYVPGLNDSSGAAMGEDYAPGTDRDLTPTNITPADLVDDVPT